MANMFTSEDRLLTTHVGALSPTPAVMNLIRARGCRDFDASAYAAKVSAAVEARVRKQAEAGVDIVADGEARSSFSLYIDDRLAGLEPRPQGEADFREEYGAFLEDFERYLQGALRKGARLGRVPTVCVGPIEYVGQEQLQRDIGNLRAAADKAACRSAFMVSIAPGGIGANAFYPTEEAFLRAAGEALRTEYVAIVEAGFLLQIDDPFLPALFAGGPHEAADRRAGAYVDALNHSLRGIPAERVRYHICCRGPNVGPLAEGAFLDVARHMLRVNAAAYSFDAARVRYEEDDDLWDAIRLPEGKAIMPGLMADAGGAREDPRDIARRLVRFAGRVGRDQLVASADHRAGGRGAALPEIVWANTEALTRGAEQASRELWAA